jgi:hypothetical protein
MTKWLVEFEGRQKPLDELKSEQLKSRIAPIRAHIERSIATLDADDAAALEVVFSVDPERGLKFTLRGPSHVVNAAIDMIGTIADVTLQRH